MNAQANTFVLYGVGDGKPLTIFEQERAIIKERLFWEQAVE